MGKYHIATNTQPNGYVFSHFFSVPRSRRAHTQDFFKYKNGIVLYTLIYNLIFPLNNTTCASVSPGQQTQLKHSLSNSHLIFHSSSTDKHTVGLYCRSQCLNTAPNHTRLQLWAKSQSGFPGISHKTFNFNQLCQINSQRLQQLIFCQHQTLLFF